MNIILRELKAYQKSLLIWLGCMIAFVAMFTAEFSAYYNNPEMSEILDAMPQALLDAFSMSNANLTTLTGFVSVAVIYFYIILGVHAVMLGSGIISKEERDKTAEFFLVLPVSRQRVIIMKLIAAVINCVVLNLVTIISIFAFAIPYDREPGFNRFMMLVLIAMFLIQMIFLSMGMGIAAAVKRYKKSSVYAVAILTGLYLVSVITALSDKVENLKYLTPFKYFEPADILKHDTLESVYVIIALCFIAAMLAVTYWLYPKRDLRL